MSVSKENVFRSTFKLTERDSGIYFILRFCCNCYSCSLFLKSVRISNLLSLSQTQRLFILVLDTVLKAKLYYYSIDILKNNENRLFFLKTTFLYEKNIRTLSYS